MTQKFIVGTGIRVFPMEAPSPEIAIATLKHAIDQRRFQHYNPEIGMSLVEALDQGRLNFVVMDGERNQVLAGELEGVYQEPASALLAAQFQCIIPQATRWASQLQ